MVISERESDRAPPGGRANSVPIFRVNKQYLRLQPLQIACG